MIIDLFKQIQDQRCFILLLETMLLFQWELHQIHFSPYIDSTHHLLDLLCIYFLHQIVIHLSIVYYQVLLDFTYLTNQYLFQRHFIILLQLQKIL